ncbi:MAG TPA: alpha/beta hydrolase [Candidatus Binataceae bacterium]|nr:alpha/beta hydrolase [Candidatus Binataceae bacterium]
MRTHKTYVLVHGAWHGGWCWRRVSPLLMQHGHRVFSPTHTGLGERAHLMTREVGIETFVQDVIGLIDMEELENIILVGHSFGGNVITCVADRMPHRIAHMVYLDAAVPTNGQNALAPLPKAVADERIRLSRQFSGGITMPIPSTEVFAVTEPADVAWLQAHLRPHPLKAYTDPIRFEHPAGNGRPVTYIACTDPEYPLLASSRDYAKKQAGWTYEEIGCGHDAMVLAPERLAELLLAIDG